VVAFEERVDQRLHHTHTDHSPQQNTQQGPFQHLCFNYLNSTLGSNDITI
jgi:hypothetical protein